MWNRTRVPSVVSSVVALAGAARAQAIPPMEPAPMVALEAAYPYGEQLCAVPIPGNGRVVVAQGAALAVVDTRNFDANGEPRVVQYVEVPEVSPMAMRYRLANVAGQVRRTIYVAGGTTGLWRVELCNDLFTSTTPEPCGAQAQIVDRVGCDATWSYKRCVDVQIVEGNAGAGGAGLLLALYAASSRTSERRSIAACTDAGQGPQDLGGTELRAYRLTANGEIVPHAAHLFSLGNVEAPFEEVGTSIAVDPGDPNRVYVSLGAGGIRRVDVSSATFTSTRLSTAPVRTCALPPFPSGAPGCPAGEQVRDLALVRLGDGSARLYAALEYGRVIEMDPDVAGSATEFVLGEFHPMQIAAGVVGANDVVVAVGLDAQGGVGFDSTCPYRPVGVWTDMCILSGLPELNHVAEIGASSRVTKVRVLARNASSGLANVGEFTTSARTNTLEMLATVDPKTLRLYTSTSVTGLESHRLTKSSPTAPWTVENHWPAPTYRPFRGIAYAAADVALSKVDDSIALGGFDGWAQDDPGRLCRIATEEETADIVPVPLTVSACPQRAEPFPTELCSGSQSPRREDPVPFSLGVAGSASWRDPFDPLQESEWFLSGHDTKWFAAPSPSCSFLPGTTRCIADPCAASPAPTSSPWADNMNIPGCGTDVGWFLARMRTGVAATGDGAQMELQWWQLPSDNAIGDVERATTTPYTSCVTDVRTTVIGPNGTPVPKFVYLARNSAKNGLKIVRTSWLMDRAIGGVPGAPGGGAACAAGTRGHGEALGVPSPQAPVGWGSNWNLEMGSQVTHLELRTSGCAIDPQVAIVDCSGTASGFNNSPRLAFNNSAHVFSVRDATNVWRTVVAVAAGFVTSGPSASNANCPWLPHYRRSLVVFYDVTGLDDALPADHPSQGITLLGAAVGPVPGTEPPLAAQASHAFSIATKTYANGRTHAFVADLLGRVIAYDVSWDKLKPSSTPPIVLPGEPPSSTKPLLVPHTVHAFAEDPFDGRRPNCVDVVIEGDALYAATARGGVHVLEINPPVAGAAGYPTYAVLDTPGIATGMALRSRLPGPMDDQLYVGDSRCGVRLYARTGQ